MTLGKATLHRLAAGVAGLDEVPGGSLPRGYSLRPINDEGIHIGPMRADYEGLLGGRPSLRPGWGDGRHA